MNLIRPAALAALSCLAAPVALAAEPAAGTAYVSNQNGDISVIDLATMKVTGTVDPQGKEPRGIGVTADGKLLVVANREGGRIAVIDRASGKLLRHIPIGANPEFVRMRGHLAFVSFEPESTGQAPMRPVEASGAAAPPAEAGASAGKGGHGKDDDDDKKELAQVAVVDLDKGKVLRSIVSGHETEGIEFAVDGKHILVTNEADDNVAVHDIATGKQVKVIDTKPYGKRPRGVKRSPDGKSYVVTLEFANAFIVLDERYEVIKTVKTADSPYGVSFNRAGDRLFVAAAKSKLLQVFDTKTWAPVKDVPIGSRCWHFTFTPDDKSILLACGRSNEVVVVDAAKLEPVEHIADKDLPWGIVTYPKSMGSLDRPE
jgi:YVTN family beta-propeller protein